MSRNPCAVITTIQQPTASVQALALALAESAVPLLIIGDSKGPFDYHLAGTELWTLQNQALLGFELARSLPTKHYARKNLGYLLAMDRGADCIYETDDDNAPLSHWTIRNLETHAVPLENQGWTNVYRWFSDELIWPRGLPLEAIRDQKTTPVASAANRKNKSTITRAPIQQGLANISPDVDAIWRLVLDRDFSFLERPSVILPRGAWCPFNSQSTWWWPDAYPLMYLPSYCSFRMTDIWRSFVAQRCLWEIDGCTVFHSAEVGQARNLHSLRRDFEAEVPGYLLNDSFVTVLEKLNLVRGIGNVTDNLIRCYEALIKAEIIPAGEMKLLRAWIADLDMAAAKKALATGV